MSRPPRSSSSRRAARAQRVDLGVAVVLVVVEQHQALDLRRDRGADGVLDRRVAAVGVAAARPRACTCCRGSARRRRGRARATRRAGRPRRSRRRSRRRPRARRPRCGTPARRRGRAGSCARAPGSARPRTACPPAMATMSMLAPMFFSVCTGKVLRRHLPLEDAFEHRRALGAAEDVKAVARLVQRHEEREALDVVPVRVRQQDARLALRPCRTRPPSA